MKTHVVVTMILVLSIGASVQAAVGDSWQIPAWSPSTGGNPSTFSGNTWEAYSAQDFTNYETNPSMYAPMTVYQTSPWPGAWIGSTTLEQGYYQPVVMTKYDQILGKTYRANDYPGSGPGSDITHAMVPVVTVAMDVAAQSGGKGKAYYSWQGQAILDYQGGYDGSQSDVVFGVIDTSNNWTTLYDFGTTASSALLDCGTIPQLQNIALTTGEKLGFALVTGGYWAQTQFTWHPAALDPEQTGDYNPIHIVQVVPEPMTMTLLGLGGLAMLRRRKA